MSLSDYLKKHYLTADKPPRKKSRKLTTGSSVGEVENPSLQSETHVTDQTPKKKGWKSITGDPIEPHRPQGPRPGLQTAQEIDSAIQEARGKLDEPSSAADHDTIYRDASGRKVDLATKIKMERTQDTSKLEEQKSKLLNMGLVQKNQALEELQKLEEMKSTPLNRYANDTDLNEAQKSEIRFLDPAAKFLKNAKKKVRHSKTEPAGSAPESYKGPYNPNRFSIAPGHRWDGVDRSNGFEAKWFASQADKRDKKALSYTMAVDF